MGNVECMYVCAFTLVNYSYIYNLPNNLIYPTPIYILTYIRRTNGEIQAPRWYHHWNNQYSTGWPTNLRPSERGNLPDRGRARARRGFGSNDCRMGGCSSYRCSGRYVPLVSVLHM